MSSKLRFPSTNENMYVIRDALTPSSRDNIYSVAGALDMPFMFLEQGAQVTAVDYDWDQIEFGELRKKYLVGYNRPEPMNVPDKNVRFSKNIALRNTYMSELQVSRVVEHLPKLKLWCADMLSLESSLQGQFSKDTVQKMHGDFNKVYLSNIFDHYFCTAETPEGLMVAQMDSFFQKFASGTLFCLTERFLGFDFAQSSQVTEHRSLSERLSAQDDYWNIHLVEKK